MNKLPLTILASLPLMVLANPATPDGTVETIRVQGKRLSHYTEITEDTQKLVELPGTMGDPIAAISTLPGVSLASGGEPAVRGSSPGDNRYYIDGIPAGYIFHSFNTSIFDENTVQDFQFHPAGFGAQFSGATGAIFDIRMRDPKQQKLETTVTASMLRAGIFVEGELTEDAAFYLSARKGLMQFFVQEGDEDEDAGLRVISPPEDSDYLVKAIWDLSPRDSLTFSMLGARDFAEAEFSETSSMANYNPDFAGRAMLEESFESQGVTWNHLTQSQGEFKLIVAHYQDTHRVEWGDDYFEDVTSSNALAKASLRQPLTKQHTLTMGIEYSDTELEYSARTVHFVCGEFDVDCSLNRGDILEDKRSVTNKESTIYLIDFWKITDDFHLETGLQWHHNSYLGEAEINPRIASSWYFLQDTALTASAGRYSRLPETHAMLPVIGNPNLRAPLAKHYTLGLKGDISDEWSWSIETYYKDLSRLPLAIDEDEPDAELFYSNDLKGKARGVDLLISKNMSDNWYGWISLSYSQSERTNGRTGETRDHHIETPVIFNLVSNWRLNESWTGGFRFIAKSGEATTQIIGIESNPNFPDHYIPTYGAPYDDRLPTYSRLDIRFQRNFTMFDKEAKFFIDILNVLNRENITERTLDMEKVQETGQLYVKEDAEMGIFPSIGISFSF